MDNSNQNSNKKSKLERLSQQLYSRINPPKLRGRRRLFRGADTEYVSEDVDPEILGIKEEEKEEKNEEEKPPLSQFYDEELLKEDKEKFWTAPKIFLLVAFFVFIFSSTLAYFFIVSGLEEANARNVRLAVKGPNNVESGELMQLQVLLENANPKNLEDVTLIVDYPQGTIIPSYDYTVVDTVRAGKKVKVVRYKSLIESISAGALRKGTINARLFGKKGETQKIYLTLEYRIAGKSAVYSINKEYQVKIISDALTIDIEGPEEAISGQDPIMKVKLKNNSKSVMSFIVLKALLPLGVKIVNAAPDMTGPNSWFIDALNPGEEYVVYVTFRIDGQNGDERVIRFVAGIKDVTADKVELATEYQETEHRVKVARPFLSTILQIGKKTSSNISVVNSGSVYEGILSWKNTLPTSIEDLVVAMSLEGEALNKYEVAAQKGFYKSVDNIIVWDKTTTGNKFAFVSPSEGGELKFKIGIKDKNELLSLKNPKVLLTIHAGAKRVSEDGVIESLVAAQSQELRVETDLEFSSASLYFSNPLESKGPLPPKVDTPTVYGIEWTVTNTTNDAKDVVVTAFLPPNVSWGKLTMPATERISYNPVTGKIVWDLGTVKAGTGYYLPARKVYFNVVAVPSVTQIGKEMVLVQNQKIVGKDTWTDTNIEYTILDTNSRVLDPEANEYYYQVVK